MEQPVIRQRLQTLRLWMQQNGIEAFIVPSNDPHFSEYVASHWACRAWISGFDGSAGTMAVTSDRVALWTDSRYFLQAENQLNGTGIELQRIGIEDTPTIAKWLAGQSAGSVGVDGRLLSKITFDQLRQEAAGNGIELTSVADPFDTIWPNRPELPTAPAMLLDVQYSGESTLSKLQRIRALQSPDSIRLVAVLDEIAWTLNVRGRDVDYNPLIISYLVITPEKVILFSDPQKFSPEDRNILKQNAQVEIVPYAKFDGYLSSLGAKEVVISPNSFDFHHYSSLREAGAIISEDAAPYGLISSLKAIKNPIEIEGFRRAMEMDGVALVRFEMWLERIIEQGYKPTELEVAAKLHDLRTREKMFQCESFETISGYGKHGAIVHYSATSESDMSVDTDNFLLIDSGAQYLWGTTDITRTYHFGKPTTEQKRDYTAVLKGMIDLSAARFPIGTRGTQLDVLARRHLWQLGNNYLHGTGHGVGHFLCVHEGPQSIRMNENPVSLRSGMVQSCEPGLYVRDKYGIRIENITLVVESEHPGFLQFEPLTLCPISLSAVDLKILEKPQKKWLNQYHRMVCDRLSPYLKPAELQWLTHKTQLI